MKTIIRGLEVGVQATERSRLLEAELRGFRALELALQLIAGHSGNIYSVDPMWEINSALEKAKALSEPEPDGGSSPSDSSPVPAADSSPVPAADSSPVPAADNSPGPAVDCAWLFADEPAADSSPVPAAAPSTDSSPTLWEQHSGPQAPTYPQAPTWPTPQPVLSAPPMAAPDDGCWRAIATDEPATDEPATDSSAPSVAEIETILGREHSQF